MKINPPHRSRPSPANIAWASVFVCSFTLLFSIATAQATPTTGLGHIPESSTLGTLAAGTTLAFLMSLAGAIKRNQKIKPLALFAETVGGTVGGLMLVLIISDRTYLPFNSAVVICAVGGAFGWGTINAIASFIGTQYKINIQPVKEFDSAEGEETADNGEDARAKAKGGKK